MSALPPKADIAGLVVAFVVGERPLRVTGRGWPAVTCNGICSVRPLHVTVPVLVIAEIAAGTFETSVPPKIRSRTFTFSKGFSRARHFRDVQGARPAPV